jgi:hypothetical protein
MPSRWTGAVQVDVSKREVKFDVNVVNFYLDLFKYVIVMIH